MVLEVYRRVGDGGYRHLIQRQIGGPGKSCTGICERGPKSTPAVFHYATGPTPGQTPARPEHPNAALKAPLFHRLVHTPFEFFSHASIRYKHPDQTRLVHMLAFREARFAWRQDIALAGDPNVKRG